MPQVHMASQRVLASTGRSKHVRTARSRARGPVVPELIAKLAAGGGPVVFDCFAEIDDVSLEVELILLEP